MQLGVTPWTVSTWTKVDKNLRAARLTRSVCTTSEPRCLVGPAQGEMGPASCQLTGGVRVRAGRNQRVQCTLYIACSFLHANAARPHGRYAWYSSPCASLSVNLFVRARTIPGVERRRDVRVASVCLLPNQAARKLKNSGALPLSL